MKNVLTILKSIGSLLAVMLPLLCACSQKGPRTIENPYFRSGPSGIKILSVELTDSATFVTIDHKFYPNYWILWVEGTYAKVGSDRYEAIGGDGIVLGEELWMDESGDSVYVLKFKPVPFSAKSMDIIEGDVDGAFEILGIDLTGKVRPKQNRLIPVPAESDSFPPFDETIAQSTIRFHCLNNASARDQECTLVLEDMFSQNSEDLKLDENGYAEYSFTQRGSANFLIGINQWIVYRGFIAPGETVDVYFDAEALGVMARTGENPIPVSSEGIRYSGSKGSRYDAFQNLILPVSMDSYLYDKDAVKDFHISAEDYTGLIDSVYTTMFGSLDTLDMNPAVKELNRISLLSEALNALVNCKMIISNCYALNSKSRNDYMPHFDVAVMDKANMESFLIKHPVDRQKSISIPGLSSSRVGFWMYGNGMTDSWLSELGQACDLVTKADNAQLSEDDLSFEWNFLNEALRSLQKDAEACLDQVTSFTTVEDFDDAGTWLQNILSRYKGKVVMIDLWNTWCDPCTSAIAANEPIKNSELNSDDIIWIYIADESSPLRKYTEMIKDIRGIHIRLTKSQKSKLCDYFNVDGIPYYILVDREGNYEGRPDLRDHKNYINAIKGLL